MQNRTKQGLTVSFMITVREINLSPRENYLAEPLNNF